MVIPLRTIFYGIPILVVGVLAALPFRRAPQPAPDSGMEQPSPVDDWSFEPIEEISAAEFADWDSERLSDPADSMHAMVASLPPIADSYQAVAVPLRRPSKIAERYSAVARDDREHTKPAETLGPLVGHPAELASVGIRRSSDSSSQERGWRTAIPIGRPPSAEQMPANADGSDRLVVHRDSPNSERPSTAAPAEASSLLPPPRTTQGVNKNSSTSSEPWPTLAELASVKRANTAPAQMVEAQGPVKPTDTGAGHGESALSGITPASSFTELDQGSAPSREASDRSKSVPERLFIREPTSERG